LHLAYKIQMTLALCTILLLMVGCASKKPLFAPDSSALDAPIHIQLNEEPASAYRSVSAHFFSRKSKLLTYRVIADLEKTTLWFENLVSIEPLEQYSNTHFLLRSIISSPWPLQKREIISCVKTDFSATQTRIEMSACSDKAALDKQYLRITQTHSHWTITEQNEQVKVSYQAWIDPAGNIPALFFNRQLILTTKRSLLKLRTLINQAENQDYNY